MIQTLNKKRQIQKKWNKISVVRYAKLMKEIKLLVYREFGCWLNWENILFKQACNLLEKSNLS